MATSTETVAHTPGPWSIGKWNDHTNGYAIDAPSVHHIGTAHYLGGTLQASANARLIAAAPDLLAALERILNLHDRMPPEHPSRLSHGEEQQARDAISMAKGL